MSALRILIADDHTLVRQGVRKILETQPGWVVVAEASDGRDAVHQTLELQPDIVVMDLAMPRLNGIEAVNQIERRDPNIRVLVLSMYADKAYVTRAVRAGAAGYLLKDSADVELIHAVNAVCEGQSFFSPVVARVLLDEFVHQLRGQVSDDRFETLSEREREVFQLIAEGHSNKRVATLLEISPTTVETHRAHIMEKLDLHNTADIVLCAVRKGIVR